MKKLIRTSFLITTLAPLMGLISCSNDYEYESSKMLESFINLNVNGILDKNVKDKEIIAFKSERPNGINLEAGMGFVYYQLRCGLIGTAKVELMHSTDSLDRDIYFGKKWRTDLGGIFTKNFILNNTNEYDKYIKEFYSDWAISDSISRKNAPAYKLTPTEIEYDAFLNPHNTPEFK